MASPTVQSLPPAYDGPINAHLRGYLADDGGLPCSVAFYVWTEVVKPGHFYKAAEYPNKTTGSTVAHTYPCEGFKYQQRFYVVASNADGSSQGAVVPYWPLLDSKLNYGQPFVLTDYAEVWSGPQLQISCTTDIHCHLTMIWSAQEPWIKSRAHRKRGTVLWHDGEHGITVNGSVAQSESGDTREHSFVLNFPAIGGQRWWFFVGTVDSRISKSTTPIFEGIYTPPFNYPVEWNAPFDSSLISYQGRHRYSTPWAPQLSYTATAIDWWVTSQGTDLWPHPFRFSVWTCDANYKPLVLICGPWINDCARPDPGVWVPLHSPFPDIPVAPGQKYALVYEANQFLTPYTSYYWRLRKGSTIPAFPDIVDKNYGAFWNPVRHDWYPWTIAGHGTPALIASGHIP